MKSDGLIRDPEIAIELLELTAQSGETARHCSGIADVVIRAKETIEGRFDERRFCRAWTLGCFCQPRGHAFAEINANSGFHGRLTIDATRGPLSAQTNHVRVGYFLIDVDERSVSTCASAQSQAWINLNPSMSTTPAPALDGAQEAFDLLVECGRFFQIDRMAGIWTDPKAGIGKCGFQHQVGFEAGDVFVADGKQHWGAHPRELIV